MTNSTESRSGTDPLIPRVVATFLGLSFLVSWTGALLVASPSLLRHQPVPKMVGLLMFPAMLAGPSLVGLLMTAATDGGAGLRQLLRRILRIRLAPKWYATLLVPPILIASVLFALKGLVSPAFAPNTFFVGLSFGAAAGLIEEIGWTGFALPRMAVDQTPLRTGLSLGVIWGLWHLPVIDFLGAASPHGDYLIPFTAAFIAVMTAIRIIMAWIYSRVHSVALAQMMHAVSTGCLVALGPSRVTPAQETLWYALYAIALWTLVMVVSVARVRTKSAGGMRPLAT